MVHLCFPLAGDRGGFERLSLRSLVKVRMGGEMLGVERNSESFLWEWKCSVQRPPEVRRDLWWMPPIPQRLSLSGELTPVNFREAQDFRQWAYWGDYGGMNEGHSTFPDWSGLYEELDLGTYAWDLRSSNTYLRSSFWITQVGLRGQKIQCREK